MTKKMAPAALTEGRGSSHGTAGSLGPLVLLVAVSLVSCRIRKEEPPPVTPPPVAAPAIAVPRPLPRTELVPLSAPVIAAPPAAGPPSVLVLAIGSFSGSAQAGAREVGAVEQALAVLAMGGNDLDAAVAAAASFEEDSTRPTWQVDAAVIDSEGRFGAVAAVPGLRFPALAARALADTSTVVLSGQGALAFAAAIGLEPPTAASESTPAPAWRTAVLVRGADGRFAGALSAAEASGMPVGRVGDVPVPGAALFAGPEGIVAASGPSERLLLEQLARKVYDELARTGSLTAAAALGRELLGEDESLTLAILGDAGMLVVPPNVAAFAAYSDSRLTTSGEEDAP